MRWLAWAACLGLAAVVAVAAHGWQARGIATRLQPIDHALVSADGRQVTCRRSVEAAYDAWR